MAFKLQNLCSGKCSWWITNVLFEIFSVFRINIFLLLCFIVRRLHKYMHCVLFTMLMSCGRVYILYVYKIQLLAQGSQFFFPFKDWVVSCIIFIMSDIMMAMVRHVKKKSTRRRRRRRRSYVTFSYLTFIVRQRNKKCLKRIRWAWSKFKKM